MYMKENSDLIAWIVIQHKLTTPAIFSDGSIYFKNITCKLFGRIGINSSISRWRVIHLKTLYASSNKIFECLSPVSSTSFNSMALTPYLDSTYMQLISYSMSKNKSDSDIYAILEFDQQKMKSLNYYLD